MLKRILAIIGLIILCVLYLSVFIFSLMDNPLSSDLFKVAITATIVVPIVLYVVFYIFGKK